MRDQGMISYRQICAIHETERDLRHVNSQHEYGDELLVGRDKTCCARIHLQIVDSFESGPCRSYAYAEAKVQPVVPGSIGAVLVDPVA